MLSPMILEVNWNCKIKTLCSKSLENFIISSMAHLPSSSARTRSGGTHRQRILPLNYFLCAC
ncbi:hypothetical protein BVRB_6g145170 [Beta vulgaris subsp. vulgaris]|uniref:Uncharacterized protein n=1 Tax=Beta vulgaris subsp. vulgaris TaxID=3555 RepID=A0A0J8C7B0_BETVV|nr:hypothetical protein BVRB_6g145170 [Beta vulgaris subsp. vulgaris]